MNVKFYPTNYITTLNHDIFYFTFYGNAMKHYLSNLLKNYS